MKGNVLRLAAAAALMGAMGDAPPVQSEQPGRTFCKTPLTPKQKRNRAKSKMARTSRKINYRKQK